MPVRSPSEAPDGRSRFPQSLHGQGDFWSLLIRVMRSGAEVVEWRPMSGPKARTVVERHYVIGIQGFENLFMMRANGDVTRTQCD